MFEESQATIKMDMSQTVEAATRYTQQTEKENLAKIKKGMFIAFIIGLVGIVAYLVLTFVFIFLEIYYDIDFMLIFSLPFGFGLVFWLTVKKTVKNAENRDMGNYYVFGKDAMIVSTYINGEFVAQAKLYYKEFTKLKETEHYVFFCSPKGNFGLDKSALSVDNLALVKDWYFSCRPQEVRKVK